MDYSSFLGRTAFLSLPCAVTLNLLAQGIVFRDGKASAITQAEQGDY
jgi:hypothetical protein